MNERILTAMRWLTAAALILALGPTLCVFGVDWDVAATVCAPAAGCAGFALGRLGS